MILRKLALRSLRSHRVRTILTIASIVIGVGCVVSVHLASGSARRSFAALYQTMTGAAALEVTAVGDTKLSEDLVSQVASIPGVRAVAPLLQRPTVIYLPAGRVRLIVLGVDPAREGALRDYELTAGTLFHEGRGILLDQQFAQRQQVDVGDSIRMLTRRGLVTTHVAGLIRPRAGGAISRGSLIFMPLEEAQRRFRAVGSVDKLQIELQPDADVDAVREAVVERLPTGAAVHAPASHSPFAQETLLSFDTGMRMAATFSLLAAVFIIANTFFMNVGQQRGQLAILRAIGTTRSQVLGLIYREAFLLAAAGTGLGLLLGWGGAHLVIRSMGTLLQTDLPPPAVTATPFLLAAAFGMGVSALGAYFPARQAARVTPLEGLNRSAQREGQPIAAWVPITGAVVALVAIGLLAARMTGRLPWLDSVVMAIVLLLALVPLMGWALKPLTIAAAWPLRLCWPVESRLAQRQLLRHRTRTSLSIGVLFIASATGFGLASSLIDNVQNIQRWYRAALVGDFFVRASMPDMATWTSAPVPDEVGQRVEQVEGITGLDRVRLVTGTAEGQRVLIVAREYPSDEYVGFASVALSPGEVRRRLAAGEVVVGTVLAQRTGLSAGDQIRLETQDGIRPLTIAAVADDYQAGGLTIHMRRDVAQRLLGIEGVDVYLVKAERDRLQQVEAALRRIAEPRGVIVQSFAELVRTIDGMTHSVVASLWALLVLGLVVAALGVANTLNMNVLEQARELAMLRLVAMTRGQTRRMIFAQALILGLVGILPGIVSGIALAYLINLSTFQAIGHRVEFALHPQLTIGGFFAAMVLVALAAWPPAERAARQNAAQALRAE